MERIVTLDFSKPRLRVDGKSVDKFTVASLIDSINPFCNAVISMDVFDYHYMINWLKEVLLVKNNRGIYGETYNIVAI